MVFFLCGLKKNGTGREGGDYEKMDFNSKLGSVL